MNRKKQETINRLKEEEKTLDYSSYMGLKNTLDLLEKKGSELEIEKAVWTQAREICFDIADETFVD